MTGKYDRHVLDKINGMISLAESGQNYDAAFSQAVVCARSPEPSLRMNALHCFGYVARVYRRLNLDVALPLLWEGEKDPVPDVAAAARDALDDLEVFLPN